MLLRTVWQTVSGIGCKHPHPPQPLMSGDIVMLTNQVGLIAVAVLLLKGIIAAVLGNMAFMGYMLFCCMFFVPIWQLTTGGYYRWARTYASAAMYVTILFIGLVVLDGTTECYLYCIPFVTIFFALFRKTDNPELWVHVGLNSLVFVLMAYFPTEGLNWADILPEKRFAVVLSSRLGSMLAAIASLWIWIDLQQNAATTLERQKNFYEQIINAIELPVAVFDEQLRFRLVNKASFSDADLRQVVIGKTEQEYAQMTGRHPERAALRTAKLNKCLQENRRILFEERYEVRGIQQINIGILEPFKTAQNERFVVAYLIDISSLRRYENQIRQSQQTFEAVFENATDALFLVNTATTRIENCNAAALALFGYTDKRQIKDKPVSETLLHVPQEFYSEVIKQIQQHGKWEGEHVYTRTDGSTFTGSVAVSRFMRQNEQFTLLRISDCSEQKKAEQAIEAALKSAQEAAQAKSQFLSKISHEIRTPLNAIVGLSRLMIEDTTAVSRHNIEVIYQSSASLLEMVNEILSFAKLEKGKEILHEQPADWHELLNRIMNRMRWLAERKGLQLIQETDPLVPHRLQFDSLRLEQIINNLLSNAVKFTEKGYVKVTVTGKTLPEDRYRLVFSVADTGIGIPDDKKSLIFESFRQADQEIAYRFGGTGLGLAIAKQLVQMMNGDISVEDNPGGGAVFKFHVVLQIPKQQDLNHHLPKMSDTIPQDLKGLSILMAEDNTVNQFVARQIMSRWNVKLTFANNGQEAVDLLAKNKYGLVLMDIQMPVMDGIEAAKRIRSAPPESGIDRNIPIIALTADAMPETKEKIKAAGMNDIVVKPFDSDSLYALIKTFLD